MSTEIRNFSKIFHDHGGELIFLSKQDTITNFLAGPVLNYEGVCLALVIMWLAQDAPTTSPLKGTKNKTTALNKQNSMEANWKGFDTVQAEGQNVINAQFWWKSQSKHSLNDDPAIYFNNDPQYDRDGLHIFVLYQDVGAGHAIGVWRIASSGKLKVYDPNHGACEIDANKLSAFLKDLVAELYPEMTSYAVCSWCAKK